MQELKPPFLQDVALALCEGHTLLLFGSDGHDHLIHLDDVVVVQNQLSILGDCNEQDVAPGVLVDFPCHRGKSHVRQIWGDHKADKTPLHAPRVLQPPVSLGVCPTQLLELVSRVVVHTRLHQPAEKRHQADDVRVLGKYRALHLVSGEASRISDGEQSCVLRTFRLQQHDPQSETGEVTRHCQRHHHADRVLRRRAVCVNIRKDKANDSSFDHRPLEVSVVHDGPTQEKHFGGQRCWELQVYEVAQVRVKLVLR
mmetsp:Transcript_12541/g.29943  ORF Transcript_12541/g.29943 Transcript_12541/m.29943 type:complete len:255 (+) Transcript_12541:1697-2461(+)